MLSLLKQLFSFREGPHARVTVLNEESDSPHTGRINKLSLWYLCSGALIATIIVVVLLLRFTPLKNLLFDYHELKQTAIHLHHKVALIEDTLQARKQQLRNMKKVMLGKDHAKFTVDRHSPDGKKQDLDNNSPTSVAEMPTSVQTEIQIPENGKLVENLFDQAPDFPTAYPVEGTLTRGFNINSGHYGIDIATNKGAAFRAIADGVIISEEWTFNYGYVVIVQHAGGILTVFKHVRTLQKAPGQIVRRGDIIGTVGNVGILSTGPHLHVEIWKNGIPQNPNHYFINLKSNK